MPILKTYGVAGAVGLLLGLAAIALVEPYDAAGATLILVVAVALAVVVGALVRALGPTRSGGGGGPRPDREVKP